MEDPAKEIEQVILNLTTTASPEVQKATVEKYYDTDAQFRHPLCTVPPGPNSREYILRIYQWYRIMSPRIKLEVRKVTYDDEKKELFCDVVQEFHIRWSPFRPAPSRLLVHLKLRPSVIEPNRYFISLHEDFYHPEDLVALVFPPLIPIAHGALKAGTLASAVNAYVFGLLGRSDFDTK
ncbi:hypothetical protein K474DRAFT_1771374 [Panus rudis PR-1116 ss-1]|nr:hypothetical protein K474DRAFT_1771374 [Panus rudis PR-1116 ss-1]